MNNYGIRLKAVLHAKGVKQVELAEAVGSNPKNISSYIAGRSEPALDTANKIAKYLDVPIDYFLGNVSLENLKSDYNLTQAIDELRKNLSDDVCVIIELAVLLKNADIRRIMDIVRSIDNAGIKEILKQAEKEYFIHLYQK